MSDRNTTLAKLVTHQEFVEYFRQDMLEKSTLIKSGVAVPDAAIAAKVAAGSGLEGKTLSLPSMGSLDGAADAVVPTEATGVDADSISAADDVAVVQFLRKKFGVTDIARIMGNADPMAHIVSQLTPYWLKQDNKRFISLVKGIFASNDRAYDSSLTYSSGTATSNSTTYYENGGNGDMTFDITGESGTAANLAKDTLLLGAQKMGDRADELTAVAMNSATAAYLAAIDSGATLYRPSEALGQLAKYNGRDIIVDDNIPYDSTNKVATIYLFGKGVAAYNELPVPTAFEMDRDANLGVDYIHSWRRFILHIRGFKAAFTPSGLGPTASELETAGNWTRVFDQKRIPLVRVKAKLG